jgi:hypothetical protein
MSKISLLVTTLVPFAAFSFGCQERPTDPLGQSFAKGGNGGKGASNTLVVEFRQTPSAELEAFFGGVTLDFVSEPQPVQGRFGEKTLETKFSPFTLTLEPRASFYDGWVANEEVCTTGFLETILNSAEQNGGSLDGSLKLLADWDDVANGTYVFAQFRVAVGDYEYEITTPQPGSPGEDHLIPPPTATQAVLALTTGHFDIRRRELGTKGTWWEIERCFVSPSRQPQGPIDFEVWVTM